jgi:tRNA threonylcarbamoyladenosine modification (KEOPS) complex  Pcc1 subunit
MARYFFDIHDGRPFLDEEGSEHDSLSAVRKEVHRTLSQMSTGLSLTKNACQLRIDVRDATDARVMTATMLVVIEVSVDSAKDLSPADSEPSFDENPGSVARRTHEFGIGRHGPSLDGPVVVLPWANQGSK